MSQLNELVRQAYNTAANGLPIGEGYEAEPLAWGSFCLLDVCGCPFHEFN